VAANTGAATRSPIGIDSRAAVARSPSSRPGPQTSTIPTTSTASSSQANTWKWPSSRKVPTSELRTQSSRTGSVGRPMLVLVVAPATRAQPP
jgi:hypothetical protein